MSELAERRTPAPASDPNAERRDSPRTPLALLVREPALGGSFEAREGNLSIGGVLYWSLHPPVGGRVEIRFFVPAFSREIRATGEVLRVTRDGTRFGTHVRFVDIPLDAEMTLARWFQLEQG
ncbi:MAG TPA: PilZ domain-containing protein [Anaeromyxobacteraceae bacterium]|nr:PilZ domain-containing protein [Anaeromyxobacteraceae bacterium]